MKFPEGINIISICGTVRRDAPPDLAVLFEPAGDVSLLADGSLFLDGVVLFGVGDGVAVSLAVGPCPRAGATITTVRKIDRLIIDINLDLTFPSVACLS
jgi:hypothetical protein